MFENMVFNMDNNGYLAEEHKRTLHSLRINSVELIDQKSGWLIANNFMNVSFSYLNSTSKFNLKLAYN